MRLLKLNLYLAACFFIVGAVSYAGDAPVLMNFEDVDIRVIVKTLSELDGKRYIIDPDVKGKITLLGSAEMTHAEAQRVIRLVLNNQGLCIVDSADCSAVVPVSKLKASGVKEVLSPSDLAPSEPLSFITSVIPVHVNDEGRLKELLGALCSPHASFQIMKAANKVVVTDYAQNVQNISAILSSLQKEDKAAVGRGIFVRRLNNASAQEVASILTNLYVQQYQTETDKSQMPLFTSEKNTNTLVGSCMPDDDANIKKIIDGLDVERKQVLVEALILEATLQKTMEYGLELAADGGVLYSTGHGAIPGNDIPSYILTGEKNTSAVALVDDVKAKGSVSVPSPGAIIRAAQKDSGINILSAPQILTLDNEEAEILVGKNLAYLKNSQVTPEGSTIRTFEFKDVGLMLRIKPKITSNNSVRLDIHQEVQDVIGQPYEGAVETSKRQASTAVIVEDGQTIIIGGLMTSQKSDSSNGIPLLSKIPFLGALFGTQGKTDTKLNLLLFMTPRVITNAQDAARISKEKQDAYEGTSPK